MREPALLVGVIGLWFIALAKLLRVLLRVQGTAGRYDMPLWINGVAFVVLGALGVWLWRE
jgi:hypothetical protein